MIDTWKKMFGPKEVKPSELELANAKIAGLQERCAVYEKRALDAEEAHAHVRRNNRILGEALHEKVIECDELRPAAEKYRRSRANLKQFRQPSSPPIAVRPY